MIMDSTPALGFMIRNKSFARLYFFPAIAGTLTEMLFGCFALECKYISSLTDTRCEKEVKLQYSTMSSG